jgi:hypothetical protein
MPHMTFFLSRCSTPDLVPLHLPQNSKVERMIRTINHVMRSLMFQASLLARYWAEILHAATNLLNLLPTKAISAPSPILPSSTPLLAPTFEFSGVSATRTSATARHRLAPHSYQCVFLDYTRHTEHKYHLQATPTPPLLTTWTPYSRQSCNSFDCPTLFFCCRYLGGCCHALCGTGVPSRARRGPDIPTRT